MKDIYTISMGNRIAELRRSRKMSQATLAEKIGSTQKHISHVESASAALSLEHSVKICKIFGCTLDYLVFGTTDDAISSKLPEEVLKILNTGTEDQISRLHRYLDLYIETLKTQD